MLDMLGLANTVGEVAEETTLQMPEGRAREQKATMC
jgi:hypothetical protein